MSNAQAFLQKVLAWPTAVSAPSPFFNIHYKRIGSDGKIYWDSCADTALAAVVNRFNWVNKLAETRDVYVCMSSQAKSEDKVSQKGNKYTRGLRTADDALMFK